MNNERKRTKSCILYVVTAIDFNIKSCISEITSRTLCPCSILANALVKEIIKSLLRVVGV